jgi:hypothetical protein
MPTRKQMQPQIRACFTLPIAYVPILTPYSQTRFPDCISTDTPENPSIAPPTKYLKKTEALLPAREEKPQLISKNPLTITFISSGQGHKQSTVSEKT